MRIAAVAAAAALSLALVGPASAAPEDLDTDGDGRASRPEVIAAIGLYLDGEIERGEVIEMIALYIRGGVTEAGARAIRAVEVRNNLPPGTIDADSVALSRREWSDASLGCPVEGYGYAQVVTTGYEVVVGGREAWAGTYRAAARGGAFRLNHHANGRSYHEDVNLAAVTGATPFCSDGRRGPP